MTCAATAGAGRSTISSTPTRNASASARPLPPCGRASVPDHWAGTAAMRHASTTRRLLVEKGGFLYDSDADNDELRYWTVVGGHQHLVVRYTLGINDSKYGRGVFATAGDFFAYARDGFDLLQREGANQPKMMSVGLHMRIIGHPSRAAGLERFLDYVMKHKDVWVCRREDIARHWIAPIIRMLPSWP